MSTIESIKKPILGELDQFNQEFDKALETDNETLKLVHKHIRNKKGKQLRPTLTILSAKVCNNANINTINVALSLELLHTASLVHDDVVDESKLRRGQESVNAIWDNQVSVLTGDYLLSESINIAAKTRNVDIIDCISQLGKRLSEGELLQISNVQKISTSEERYIEVIKKKTAKLFAVCTECGALTSETSAENVEKMRQFGELYGIAFQIRDDIFDYISTEKNIGKPVGNDIREGKITLPLLYAINQSEGAEKDVVMEIIKRKDFTADNIDELIKFAIRKGGIEYAEKRIKDFSQQALDIIKNFADSETKQSLIDLVEISVNRAI